MNTQLIIKGLIGSVFAVAIIQVIGCIGGLGGSIQVTGRILSASTNDGPNPAATVQIGGSSATTGASGAFALNVSSGETQMVVTHPIFDTFTFTFPPIIVDTDLGDFYIGPEKVRINGSVINAQSQELLEGVLVAFAGHRATTDALGEFSLLNVAYDPANEFVFFSIFGRAEKTGFIPTEFNVNQSPVNGIVTLPSILIAPISDPDPPGPPFNLWGIVSVDVGVPTGATVTLLSAGSPFRVYNVGPDGRYLFWVPPADYTLRFEKTGYQTQEIDITGFNSPDQVIRNDVTLISN